MEKHKELRSRGVNKNEISAWEGKVQGRGGLRSAPIAIASLSNRCSKKQLGILLDAIIIKRHIFPWAGQSRAAIRAFQKCATRSFQLTFFSQAWCPRWQAQDDPRSSRVCFSLLPEHEMTAITENSDPDDTTRDILLEEVMD